MLTKETYAAEKFPTPPAQHFSNGTIQILFSNEHYQCNSICLKVLFSFSLCTLVMAKVMISICVDLGAKNFKNVLPWEVDIATVSTAATLVCHQILLLRLFLLLLV